MSALQSVIEKVRRLRALSKSANEHEAAAAAATADRLIQEYRLEESALEVANGDTTAPAEDSDPLCTWGRTRPSWERALAYGVSRHYDVACYHNRTGFGVTRVVMVGRPSDVVLVREMFAFIRGEVCALAKGYSGFGRSFLASFRLGAVVGVLQAMKESKAAAMAAAPQCTALALVDRGEQSRAALAKLHPSLRSSRPIGGYSDSDGFGAGVSAGRSIDIGGARTKRLGAP